MNTTLLNSSANSSFRGNSKNTKKVGNSDVNVKKFFCQDSSDEETPQRPRRVARSASPATPQPFQSSPSRERTTSSENTKTEGELGAETSHFSKVNDQSNTPVGFTANDAKMYEERRDDHSVNNKNLITRDTKKRESSHSTRMSIYERSKRQAAATAEKLEKLRFFVQEAEREQYTFRPHISKKSQRLLRSPLDAVESVEKYRERLRSRIREAETQEECTFTPQICQESTAIVYRRRSSSGQPLDVINRLYNERHNHVRLHEITFQKKDKKVRTAQEIERHVASLYGFHEKKTQLLRLLREQQFYESKQTPSTISAEVVARLTAPRPRISTDSLISDSAAAALYRNPLHDRKSRLYLQNAKTRSHFSWFHHFSNGSNLLSTTDLEEYEGPHVNVRNRIQSFLINSSEKSSWNADEFDDLLSGNSAPNIWKLRVASPSAATELFSFHPKIDTASAAIAQRFNKSDCVSAYERLYYAARNAQLSEKQKMLRDKQKELLEAEKKQRKRCKLQEEWRIISSKMMSVRTEIKEDEECGRGTTPIASSGGRGINDSSGSGEGFSLTAVNKNNENSTLVSESKEIPPGSEKPGEDCIVLTSNTSLDVQKKTKPVNDVARLAVSQLEQTLDEKSAPQDSSMCERECTSLTSQLARAASALGSILDSPCASNLNEPTAKRDVKRLDVTENASPISFIEVQIENFLLDLTKKRLHASTRRKESQIQHKQRLKHLGKALYLKSREN